MTAMKCLMDRVHFLRTITALSQIAPLFTELHSDAMGHSLLDTEQKEPAEHRIQRQPVSLKIIAMILPPLTAMAIHRALQ